FTGCQLRLSTRVGRCRTMIIPVGNGDALETKARKLDVYWTVQNGKRFTISLSEDEAWRSLARYWAYSENPVGWSVERTTEEVPVAVGKPFVADRTTYAQDADGKFVETDDGIKAPHVAWDCPICGKRHTCDLCHDLECRTPPDATPQLW